MGQPTQASEAYNTEQKSPAQVAADQEKLKKQMEEQAAALEAIRAQNEANLKLSTSGLMGDYGPIAQGSVQNADGSWSRPEYNSILDPTTGLLREPYQLRSQLNEEGLNRFREEALRDPGAESAWLKLALEQADMDKMQRLDDLGLQLNASTRQAYDDLASTGGLDSGARERVARGSLRDFMRSKQDIARDAMMGGQNLRIQDEQNRIQQLSQLPGMETQRASYLSDVDTKNIAGALGEREYAYNQEMEKWIKNQETWAANKQADAQARAACFSPETKIEMADGSTKMIKDIEIGDETKFGGVVHTIMCGRINRANDCYKVGNAIITGNHLFLDKDDTWKAVRDIGIFERVEENPKIVYNIGNEHHLLAVEGFLLSDYEDTDDFSLSDEEGKEEKNRIWKSLRNSLNKSTA